MDEKARRGELIGDLKEAVVLMLREVKTLTRLGNFQIVPLTGRVLKGSIAVALRHHIYIVDALQIACRLYAKCDALYTANGELAQVAEREGVKAVML